MSLPLDSGGLRSILPKIIPNWLANRIGKNAGFRFLWVMACTIDFFIQAMLEGFRAPLPGVGTSTALATIGQSRGLLQGISETADAFIVRLQNWIAIAKTQGSQMGIVTQMHAYLGLSAGTISVINRAGVWTVINIVGTVTRGSYPLWDWDSISTPYRSGYWSDEWVITAGQPWNFRGAHYGDGLTFGRDTLGVTHLVDRLAYSGALSVLNQFKAAHSNVRSIIFGGDFTSPDGVWGKWGQVINFMGNTYYEPSDRFLYLAYWEPTIPDGVTIL
jgi:hypothetical protein